MGFADAPFVFGCALLVGPAALPGFNFFVLDWGRDWDSPVGS